MEYGTPRLPLQIDVTILAADPARLGEALAKFSHVVVGAPERGPDGDGGQLAAGVLEGIGLTCNAVVFLGQPRVEHPAEVHVVAGATGGEDDAFARTNVQGLTLIGGLDSQDSAR